MVTLVGESYCRKYQTDADCAKGFDKCDIQPFCVAKENTKNVCPKPKDTKCAEGEVVCPDGLCRKNFNQCATRRACPIDFKLCPNGTCSLTLDRCSKSEECGSNQVRCVNDQSCADSYDKCPSPIVCPKNDMVVCPDNTCRNSELECSAPKLCTGDNTVLCQDGTCVTDAKYCLKGVVCSLGLAYCGEGNKCVEVCNSDKLPDNNLTAEELTIRLKPNWELEEIMRKKRIAEEAENKRIEEERARIAAEEEKKRKEAEEKARIAAEEERKKKQAEAELAEKLRQIKESAERAAREAAERVRAEAERLRQSVCNNNRNWLNSNVYNRVPLYSTVGREILNGSSIKLMHLNTNMALHSHGNRIPSGSGQQEVTGYWERDQNDWFRIFLISGNMENGAVVRLQHNQTGGNIFIDNGNFAERSKQLEASTRPYNGDQRFHFRIEVITPSGCDNSLRVGDLIRLVNIGTNATLHSHDIRNNGTGQFEVTGFPARDTNDYYVISEESH